MSDRRDLERIRTQLDPHSDMVTVTPQVTSHLLFTTGIARLEKPLANVHAPSDQEAAVRQERGMRRKRHESTLFSVLSCLTPAAAAELEWVKPRTESLPLAPCSELFARPCLTIAAWSLVAIHVASGGGGGGGGGGGSGGRSGGHCAVRATGLSISCLILRRWARLVGPARCSTSTAISR